MINLTLKNSIKEWLSENIDSGIEIKSLSPVSGGSINESYKVSTTNGEYFLKFNTADLYPGMFETELAGLKLIESTRTIFIPKVFHCGITDKYSYLLLQFEEQGSKISNFWETFASGLASLHRNSNDTFGLDHDNYIGSLPQINVQHTSLHEFIVLNRLQPLVKRARDNKLLNTEDIRKFELLYNKLDNLIQIEKPSLLHGDLWSGNLISNSSGEPCVIDPAVYYGHRETEIAMTRLFGGFPPKFYDVYNSIFPLENGWEERIDFHQLYPLLVHVNLFGESYAYDVRRILKRYII